MPLKLTSIEHVKKQGDFKLDRLWVKRLSFDNNPKNGSTQQLTIEVLPFAYLEGGTRVFFNDSVEKIFITDIEQYLIDTGDLDLLTAYDAIEKAVVKLINTRTEWTAIQEEGL